MIIRRVYKDIWHHKDRDVFIQNRLSCVCVLHDMIVWSSEETIKTFDTTKTEMSVYKIYDIHKRKKRKEYIHTWEKKRIQTENIMPNVFISCQMSLYHVKCLSLYHVFISCQISLYHVKCLYIMSNVFMSCQMSLYHVECLYIIWHDIKTFDMI